MCRFVWVAILHNDVGVPLFPWYTREEGDTFTCKHMLPVQKAIYSLLVGNKGERAESSYKTSLKLLAPCPEKVCIIEGLQILRRIEAIYILYLKLTFNWPWVFLGLWPLPTVGEHKREEKELNAGFLLPSLGFFCSMGIKSLNRDTWQRKLALLKCMYNLLYYYNYISIQMPLIV